MTENNILTDAERIDNLHALNESAKQLRENMILSSILDASLDAYDSIDSFSTWLLVATAATASFIISNVDKLLPLIKQTGFIVIGVFICLSCLFGLFSKLFGLQCKMNKKILTVVKTSVVEQLEAHSEVETQIKKFAEIEGIKIDTEINFQRLTENYLSFFPRRYRFLTFLRFLRKKYKNTNELLIGHEIPIKNLNMQGLYATLQALSFMGFLGSAFYFIATS